MRLSLGTDGDDTVVLTVSDDGPGFDPASALGPVDGHIGLALLADAAEGIGGRLDLRSRLGRGTTVTLLVPIPLASRSPRVPPAIVTRDQTSQPV